MTTIHEIAIVAHGRVTPFHDYELMKCRDETDGKFGKVYYKIFIDGDDELVELSLREAKDYVKRLRDEWLETHPEHRELLTGKKAKRK